MGVTLPYDGVLALRDRMWEISPAIVKYDATEATSTLFAAAGLAAMAGLRAASASGKPFKNPIHNFYQTDPISRASVTMANCTRTFVEQSSVEGPGEGKQPQASFG